MNSPSQDRTGSADCATCGKWVLTVGGLLGQHFITLSTAGQALCPGSGRLSREAVTRIQQAARGARPLARRSDHSDGPLAARSAYEKWVDARAAPVCEPCEVMTRELAELGLRGNAAAASRSITWRCPHTAASPF